MIFVHRHAIMYAINWPEFGGVEVLPLKWGNVGFAVMLLGVIFAAPGDSLFWFIGLALGVIGLLMILAGAKSK